MASKFSVGWERPRTPLSKHLGPTEPPNSLGLPRTSGEGSLGLTMALRKRKAKLFLLPWVPSTPSRKSHTFTHSLHTHPCTLRLTNSHSQTDSYTHSFSSFRFLHTHPHSHTHSQTHTSRPIITEVYVHKLIGAHTHTSYTHSQTLLLTLTIGSHRLTPIHIHRHTSSHSQTHIHSHSLISILSHIHTDLLCLMKNTHS